MNILLQTLSLLRYENKLNYFRYDSKAVDKEDLEKVESIPYYSSSEPAAISVIRELKANGEKLDEIIVLCSPETHLDKKTITLLDSSGKEVIDTKTDITTLEFYENELEEIFRKECADPKDRPTLSFERINGDNRLQRADSNTEIVIDIARRIQNYFKDDRSSKLYIDTQGGSRSDMFFLLSIVRLLKIHNIEPDRILLCDFFDKGPGAFQPVYDKKKEYSVFDLPSGIDEFINYAKAKQLKKFFTDSGATSNDFIRETVEIIEAIANAIQICNMVEFRENLGKLKEKCDKKEESNNELFKYVLDEIKNDYKDLLINDDATFFPIIDWCIRKEFYQQALTLLESDTVKELIRSGAVNIDNLLQVFMAEGTVREAYLKKCQVRYLWSNNNKLSKFEMMTRRAKLLLDSFIPNEITSFNKNKPNLKPVSVWTEKDFFSERGKKKSRIEQLTKIFKYGLSTRDERFVIDETDSIPMLQVNSRLTISEVVEIYEYYLAKIKTLRNSTNHGDSHVTFKEYVDTIKTYVGMINNVCGVKN